MVDDNAAKDFEELLQALLRGHADIEDVCGRYVRVETFQEHGVLTNDRGLVVTMRNGRKIHLTIQ